MGESQVGGSRLWEGVRDRGKLQHLDAAGPGEGVCPSPRRAQAARGEGFPSPPAPPGWRVPGADGPDPRGQSRSPQTPKSPNPKRGPDPRTHLRPPPLPLRAPPGGETGATTAPDSAGGARRAAPPTHGCTCRYRFIYRFIQLCFQGFTSSRTSCRCPGRCPQRFPPPWP